MTLLETSVATVLLAVAAVTCLETTREALGAARRAAAWQVAVARGDAALAAATLYRAGPLPDDSVRVTRRPYARGVVLIEVEVPLPEGGVHRLSRLIPAGVP